MRTTLEIPDEEYELISYYAKSKGISKGRAAGELARKQLAPETVPEPATRLKRMKNGLLVLSGDGRESSHQRWSIKRSRKRHFER